MGTYTPIFQLTQRLGREREPVNGGPFHSTNRPRNLLHPHVPRPLTGSEMSGSCTSDAHSHPCRSAYPSVRNRTVTQRSHACPLEDSARPQPQGSSYAHPVTALQAPTAAVVAVHWWQLAGNSTDPADLAVLAPGELERLNHIQHPTKAAEFAGSRAGVRRILAGLLGTAPEAIALGRLPCPGCGSRDHGPPAVLQPPSPFRISLSHSSGRCLLAVAQTPVGVDVEAERTLRTEELARVALTPAEHRNVLGAPAGAARSRAFLRCWTRKEAALKAVGTGIATDLSGIETHPDRRGPVAVTVGAPSTPTTWSVHDVTVPGPWVATVATPFGVPTRVTVSPHPEVR